MSEIFYCNKYSSIQESGGVEKWRSGGVEDWRSGGVEEWRVEGQKECVLI